MGIEKREKFGKLWNRLGGLHMIRGHSDALCYWVGVFRVKVKGCSVCMKTCRDERRESRIGGDA